MYKVTQNSEEVKTDRSSHCYVLTWHYRGHLMTIITLLSGGSCKAPKRGTRSPYPPEFIDKHI